MSRKTHPIGFRLGMSQEWTVTTPVVASFHNLLKQYVLYLWLNNFAQQNHFYFLRHNEITLTEKLAFLFLLGFFPKVTKSRLRRRLTHLRFLESAPLFKKRRRKKQKRYTALGETKKDARVAVAPAWLRVLSSFPSTPFDASAVTFRYALRSQSRCLLANHLFQMTPTFMLMPYWQARYLHWNRIRLRRRRTKQKRFGHILSFLSGVSSESTFKPTIFRRKRRRRRGLFGKSNNVRRFSFRGRGFRKKVGPKVVLRLRKLVRRKYLRALLHRFWLLRFKFYLQRHLNRLMSQQYVIMFQNFTDFTQARVFIPKNLPLRSLGLRLYNGSQFLVNRMFVYRQYTFLSVFVGLVLSASYVRTPHVLLQWLWNYSARVKKHSLYITHRQLFNLFFTTLENSLLLVGILKGVRVEMVGKLYNSTRTRKQMVQFGKLFKRQTIFSDFIFTAKHIPTYLGVLGFRLWFLY